MIFCFKVFEEMFLDPSSFKPHIFFIFNPFWKIQRIWVHWQRIYNTLLYSKGNKTIIKEFNLKIQNYFNRSITKNEPPYTKNPHLHVPWPNWVFCCNIESIRWKVTHVLWVVEAKEQCVKIQPPLKS
jgi:hypothetical protein